MIMEGSFTYTTQGEMKTNELAEIAYASISYRAALVNHLRTRLEEKQDW